MSMKTFLRALWPEVVVTPPVPPELDDAPRGSNSEWTAHGQEYSIRTAESEPYWRIAGKVRPEPTKAAQKKFDDLNTADVQKRKKR